LNPLIEEARFVKFSHDIEEHIPRLRRYARALAGDGPRADDLVQDTLERALNKFHLWRRGSDLRAWLFTVMHNIFVNQVRQGGMASSFVPLEDGAMDIPVKPNQEDGLVMRDLASALGQLPEEYREVVLLVGLEQMQYGEVAEVLGIPVGTVMSRLSRGREQLRLIMAGNQVSRLII
jgi:RNA polymerase sigma-70 factor (ECF subfamily)